MNPLSTEERRALGLLLALLLIAAAARWIERPKSILGEVPDVDIAALEAASRDAKDERAPKSSSRTNASSRQTSASAKAGSTTGSARAAASGARDAASASPRIDPNSASADELMQLPGVGPALATRIIAARTQSPFRTVDELQRVAGIGPALVQRMADHVALPRGAGAATATPDRGTTHEATTSPTRRVVTPQAPIDINRASAAELEAVPGIGPALARRLVARRDSLGRFRSYDDVDAVTGVGPALLARIRAATVLH